MERLTDKRFLGEGFYQPKSLEEAKEIRIMQKPSFKEIYKKLGEYENIGLQPEEIRSIIDTKKIPYYPDYNDIREMLFKGKRKDNREWMYGDLLHPDIYGNGYSIEDFTKDKNNCHEVIPETICRYTGKKDTNGKKIFEGDIIKYTRTKWDEPLNTDNGKDIISLHEVYYDEEQAAFKQNHYTAEDKKLIGSGLLVFNDIRAEENIIEIIGNIYDSPELLKGDIVIESEK